MSDERLAPAAVGSKEGYALQLSTAGVVMPAQLGDMIEFARIMCKADLAIPKHLRGNPGACLAVAMRARAWAMDPFAVSTKTYAVNDILAYESQLINAVINRHAPIKGRLVPRYTGEGPDRQCILEPETAEGQVLPYVSPKVKDIPTKNSPLWKADPDQQLFYSSSRAWARRYFPDLILGVYDPDEARSMKDITPEKPVENYLNDDEGHDAQTGEVIEPKSASKPGEKINTVGIDQSAAEFVRGEKYIKRVTPKVDERGFIVFDEATNPTEEQQRAMFDPLTQPNVVDETDPPHDTGLPDVLAMKHLEDIIAGHTDAVLLQQWQHDNHARINALPPDLLKRVRKALADKLFELEAT